MSALFPQCHISEKESVAATNSAPRRTTYGSVEAAEKAAPEVTAVVARVLTGREQFASILAPRPSLVVMAPRREEDEEERRRRRRRRGG